MIEHTKSPGPIELQYAQSDDPKLRRLSQMSNLELLGYINELVEADGAFDETMFDAVEQLLDERVPIEPQSKEEFNRSWDRFVQSHPDLFPR